MPEYVLRKKSWDRKYQEALKTEQLKARLLGKMTGMKKDKIKKLVECDTYFDVKRAIKLGVTGHVLK